MRRIATTVLRAHKKVQLATKKTGKKFRRARTIALSVKRGSKVSRLLRFVFEAKFIRMVIGTAVVFVFLLSMTIRSNIGGSLGFASSWNSANASSHAYQEQLAASQDVLSTEKGVGQPLTKMVVNQGFGFFHPGVDLDGETGDPIKPVSAGVVQFVAHDRFAYGNHVIIDHGSGFKTLYAHMSKTNVHEGQEVDKNTVLGWVGSTGWATGPHLHLEFRVEGVAVDPISYLR